MKLMKKSLAATLALAISATALPASAFASEFYGGYHEHHHYYPGPIRRHDDGGDIVAGAIIGLAAGAILGSVLSQPSGPAYVGPAPVYRVPEPVYVDPEPIYLEPAPQPTYGYAGQFEPFSPQWYSYCADRYRSFDPQTGTFQPYHGPRRLCR